MATDSGGRRPPNNTNFLSSSKSNQDFGGFLVRYGMNYGIFGKIAGSHLKVTEMSQKAVCKTTLKSKSVTILARREGVLRKLSCH